MSKNYKNLEEIFDSFERVENISEVLILRADGGIRRCILDPQVAYSDEEKGLPSKTHKALRDSGGERTSN